MTMYKTSFHIVVENFYQPAQNPDIKPIQHPWGESTVLVSTYFLIF